MPENKPEKAMVIRLNVPANLTKFKILEDKAGKDEGIIEAYVSIFGNIDLVGDIIEMGAFAESLAKKFPKGVWSHNWDMPVAKTLEAREDTKGLYIKGQFNLDTQRGKEAYSDLKFGTIDEFSIGFRVLEYKWSDENPDVRVITKARLFEWSPVLAGANPDTELISVKSADELFEKCDDVPEIKETPADQDEPEVPEKPENTDAPEDTDEEKKINKVAVITDKGLVRITFVEKGEEKVEEFKMTDNFINYKKEQKDARKQKVDDGAKSGDTTRKILRIREVAEKNLRTTKLLLKIVK